MSALDLAAARYRVVPEDQIIIEQCEADRFCRASAWMTWVEDTAQMEAAQNDDEYTPQNAEMYYQPVVSELFRGHPVVTHAMGLMGKYIQNPSFERDWYKAVKAVGYYKDASIPERVAARYKQKKLVDSEKGGKTTVYVYSEKQIARRNAEKAKRLESLRKSIGNLRTKVKRDLKSSDPERQLTALAVALMDHTAERVGNEESAKEAKHFGVTGWRKRHVSFGKSHASIKYTGKSGVQQHKKVTDKAILTALRNAYEACGDDDGGLFDHEDIGKVTAAKINAYLEPFNVSAKDLRGFHANDSMMEALRAARSSGGKLPEDKKAREKQLKAEFKQALEETAEAVGHEASTLKSQYLVPGLEAQFLKDGTVMSKMKAASFDDCGDDCVCDCADYTYDRT